MTIKSVLEQLKEDGWHLKDDFLEEFLQNQPRACYSEIVKYLLNADLKEIGGTSLSSDSKKFNQIQTPVVLQVTNVRNIAAPKSNEDSGAAPRMMRITLTDGVGFINGIEFSYIKDFGQEIAPGTKVKLTSRVPFTGGYLLLTPSNFTFLGGFVEEIYDKWKLYQSVSKYSRINMAADGSGPPAWVPFGQKIINSLECESKNGQRGTINESSKDKEDEFKNQRNLTVKELAKESSHKVFGGGKQMLDSNVQKIVNAGFTIEEAEWALKRYRNDPSRSIRELRYAIEGRSYESPSNDYETSYSKPSGRGKGRGRGRGKERDLGPDGSDEEAPQSAKTRPSGPASLSDFLQSKILEKKETVAGFSEDKRETKNYKREPGSSQGRNFREKQSNSASAESWPVVGEDPPPPPSQQQSYEQHRTYDTQRDYNKGQSRYGQMQRPPPDRYSQHSSNYYGGNQQGYYNNYASSQQSSNSYQKPYAQNNYYEQNYNNYSNNSYSYDQNQRDQYRYRDRGSYHNNYGSGGPRTSRGGRGRAHNRSGHSHQNYYGGSHESYQEDRGASSSSYNNKAPERNYTLKEKELIAQFQQSMILSGHYEPEHVHNQVTHGNNQQTERSGYQGSSFEYRRGGEGYARRGAERGARGGSSRRPPRY